MEIKSFRQFSSIINESCHSEKEELIDEAKSTIVREIVKVLVNVLDSLDAAKDLTSHDTQLINHLLNNVSDKIDVMDKAGLIVNEDWFKTKEGIAGFNDGKGGYHYGADNIAKYVKTVKASKSTSHKAVHNTSQKKIVVDDGEGNEMKYWAKKGEKAADHKARASAEHKVKFGKDLEF
jgi:hypothetical protein